MPTYDNATSSLDTGALKQDACTIAYFKWMRAANVDAKINSQYL